MSVPSLLFKPFIIMYDFLGHRTVQLGSISVYISDLLAGFSIWIAIWIVRWIFMDFTGSIFGLLFGFLDFYWISIGFLFFLDFTKMHGHCSKYRN